MHTPTLLQAAGLLLLAAAAGSAQAQGAPTLAPGTRIRVTDHSETQIGTVLSSGDSVMTYVGTRADTESIAISGISRLEVSTGMHHRILHGTVIGALGGALVGAVVGAATYRKPRCDNTQPFNLCGLFDPGAGGAAAVGTVVGAVGGATIGSILGSVFRSETWSSIPLKSHRLQATVSPTRHGLAVQAHIAL